MDNVLVLLREITENACHCDEARCVELRTQAIDSLLDRMLVLRVNVHGESDDQGQADLP